MDGGAVDTDNGTVIERKWSRPTDETQAYLEKLFAESYKREMDQDEAVWHTLPFFATALTAYGGLLAYAVAKLPPLSPNFWTNAGYVLTGAALYCGICAGAWVSFAVWPRDYRKIPQDREILNHAINSKAYNDEDKTCSAPESDFKTHFEVREMMIEEFAHAVSWNRENNRKRYKGRAKAAQRMSFGIGFLILLCLGLAIAEKSKNPEPETVYVLRR